TSTGGGVERARAAAAKSSGDGTGEEADGKTADHVGSDTMLVNECTHKSQHQGLTWKTLLNEKDKKPR
ncbi:hypothetical protein QML37_30055, partial [Klebsiella pneumoniae]|uniref:hypothetical protein n=1 Tax=Klebsiella pneumoniae TaxID=573 RepID=UPI003A7FA2DE